MPVVLGSVRAGRMSEHTARMSSLWHWASRSVLRRFRFRGCNANRFWTVCVWKPRLRQREGGFKAQVPSRSVRPIRRL